MGGKEEDAPIPAVAVNAIDPLGGREIRGLTVHQRLAKLSGNNTSSGEGT